MEIIQIPNPNLRKKSSQVLTVDKKLIKFINDLENTLANTRNPRGVGLAAPQVNKSLRLFSILIDQPLTIINPMITKHSKKQSFDPDEHGEPLLEGCLSIPKIWGPVPRWEWIELEFDQIIEGKNLKKTKKKFHGFEARVVQHEYDHLEGILFTDYSINLELPVYWETKKGQKPKEVDRNFLKLY